MFVRKKRNKSGSVSVQVVGKARGAYKVLRTVGCSADETEIGRLEERGREWIEVQAGPRLFDEDTDNARAYDAVFEGIQREQLRLVGPEMIYGALYDRIGYDKIPMRRPDLFRALVVARLYKPGSKLRTVEYLARFMGKVVSVDTIYRFLDNLCYRKDKNPDADAKESVKWKVEQVTYEHTREVVGGAVSVVFYDTTTLYFESREDDMRVPGYSKDGKHSNPQVVLGLLVAAGGNPIGYELHKGNQYEGATLVPIIKKMQNRFKIGKPVVIADAGLLNKDNIKELESDGYEYILGARIRSMKATKQAEIAGLGLLNGQTAVLPHGDGRRLVVSMSDNRAKKDAADRNKGIARLRKRFQSGNVTKDHINNRGYNRFLKTDGSMRVVIDEGKIREAAKMDGLKGYVTNTQLPADEVITNYGYLFMIERAFRLNKTDLDIRPMYHRLFNRIEAHVCVCFTSYAIMLELERAIKAACSSITLHRAKFLCESIYEIRYVNPYNGKERAVLLKTDNDPEVTELLRIIRNR